MLGRPSAILKFEFKLCIRKVLGGIRLERVTRMRTSHLASRTYSVGLELGKIWRERFHLCGNDLEFQVEILN